VTTYSGTAAIRMTVAQAIVRFLQVQFSEMDGNERRLVPGMFGIFGHGNVQGVGQALLEVGDSLPFLPARNEQAMVHIAAAYAKAQRRTSTYACTSSIGPGATNMVTGAALATINRLPVLLFPSDYFVTRRQGPVLQQLEAPSQGDLSVSDCFRPVSRYFDRITHPSQLLSALPEACRVLTSPSETGAAVLSLPQDVQSEAFDFPATFFEPRHWRIERVPPSQERLTEAIDLIRESRRPVIIAGGGVVYSGAESALVRFAHTYGIPVAETFAGKGCFDDDSWLALGGMGTSGNPAANQLLREADLVICLGTRMTDTETGSQSLFQNPKVCFISVNVSDHDARKQGALPIVADIRATLAELQRKHIAVTPNSEYKEHVLRVMKDWRAALQSSLEPSPETMTQGELIQRLNDWVKPGDVVIGASGTIPGDLLRIWNSVGGRHCYLEFGYSCMGHEIPAGIGVRLAQREGEVFVLVGDGAFLMNPTEISTAVQLGLKVTFIVSDNHGFSSIHGIKVQRTGAGYLGTEMRMVDRNARTSDTRMLQLDLGRIAEGLGAVTFRAKNAESFGAALESSKRESTSCAIVVETDPRKRLPASGAWRDIPPAEVSSDPDVRRRKESYDKDRELQRFYG